MVVDFHAEVTSERWRWAGIWTAGSPPCSAPTHVPTADGQVLPGGTAFISDVGMLTGARDSVLG